MKNVRIKTLSLLIISIFIVGFFANTYLVSSSIPESSQIQNTDLDVDGNQLSITGDGALSTIAVDDVNFEMTGGEEGSDTASVDIGTTDSHNMNTELNNSGSVELDDGDLTTPVVTWDYENTENQTNLVIDDSELGETGSIISDLDSNVHQITDITYGANANLNMEL